VSIGEALAQARHHAGLTVEQVSQRTHVRETIIRGIEGDDYSACGGDFYARGYIRILAKVVGSDPEPLIREYDEVHRAPGALSAVSLEELLRPTKTTARRPRRGWAAVLVLGLALVVVLGLVAYHYLAGSRQAEAVPSAAKRAATHRSTAVGAASPAATASPVPTPSPAPTATQGPAQPVRVLIPVGAAATGPGGGDNPQLAHRAIDRGRATAWRSDWYTSARFGNLYPGTGLLLDMGHRVTLTGIRVGLGRAHGAGFQIRVGATRAVARRPPVARATGAGGVTRVRFGRPAHGRYVLLWFTRLPANQAGTFQARVFDVKMRGR
jgi:helix-turn-helix protein